MKIWPFDPYAEASDGQYISGPDLRQALEPFRKIRAAVGNKMDIMVEFHSLWRLPAAQRIARALAEFDTYWHEDPIRMDSLDLLKQYAAHSKAPICGSEILAGRWSFKDYLETGVAGIVMFDLGWCGGISEARRIAALADAWQLPVAPHDCIGPLVFAASLHFSIWAPNALVQESVRAFYTGWYNELVTLRAAAGERHADRRRPGRASAASCCPKCGSARTPWCASVQPDDDSLQRLRRRRIALHHQRVVARDDVRGRIGQRAQLARSRRPCRPPTRRSGTAAICSMLA